MILSRILVTGASGFVGGHALPALRAAFPGARLIAGVHERQPVGWDERVGMADPVAAIREARPDAVLHLAAQSNVAASFADPAATRAANLDAALALARAIMAEAPDCRLLFASTGEVYGLSFRDGPATEDAPLRPTNPYAEAKAAADTALGEMAAQGLRVLRMRPLNHVGPGQSPGFVMTDFARQIALFQAGRPEHAALRVGALDRWRDFSDVRDVCRAYGLALGRFDALPNGAALNIASGRARRVGDILADMLALAGVNPPVEEAAAAMRPNEVIRVEGDATRAREWLGWAPVVPWEETIAAVLEDWRGRVRA